MLLLSYLTIFSLVGLVCAAAVTRRRFLPLVWAGTGLFAVSFAGWLILVWIAAQLDWRTQETFAKANGTSAIFGVLAMHSVLLLLMRTRRSLAKWVRRATIGAAFIVGIWIVVMMWDAFDYDNKFLDRLVGAVAIVGSLGTIATPLLSRLEKLDQQAAGDSGLSGSVSVSLTCPRCACEVTARANKMKRCEGCGLKIKVQFEEPRCLCGYLLLGLTGDTCPECGKPIAQDDRWRETSTGEPREKPADSEDQ